MSFFRDTDEPDGEFYRACLKGDTATVRRLLDIEDERLSRSATDPIYGYGLVPLYLALFGGRRDTVLLLSERGAGFSARCALPGKAPLTGAASGRDPTLIRLCLERGAEIDGRPELPDSVSFKDKCVYDDRFIGTETPLVAACRRQNLDAVRVLLELGANADLHGEGSALPLHLACKFNRMDLVRMLLVHGADANLAGPDRDTPLYLACRIYRVDLVRLLIAHGADVNLAYHYGQSCPLMTATEEFPASKQTLLALLEAGANLTLPCKTWFIGPAVQHSETIRRILRKWLTLMVRKYVIGGRAEHPSRNRMNHLAPQVASFLVPKMIY